MSTIGIDGYGATVNALKSDTRIEDCLNQDIDKRINKMEQQKISNNKNLANLNHDLKKVKNKITEQNSERQKYFSNKKNEIQEKIANL